MSEVDPLPQSLALAYLRRLGVAWGEATPERLLAIHRAQVERVPYENLDIYRGAPPGIDPQVSAERIVSGRGGYCYHQNGALSALLRTLGYQVHRHVGGVRGEASDDVQAAMGNHCALTVTLDGEAWLVDCGLGDALYEPIPLRSGRFRQGPFDYRLEQLDPHRWRLVHDPVQNSFHDMTFHLAPVSMSRFAERHLALATQPESHFVSSLGVYLRRADGVDGLRGLVRYRHDADGRAERLLTDEATWLATLTDDFGLSLEQVPPQERHDLWSTARRAHDRWCEVNARPGQPG